MSDRTQAILCTAAFVGAMLLACLAVYFQEPAYIKCRDCGVVRVFRGGGLPGQLSGPCPQCGGKTFRLENQP